jgi:DNA-binding MarR family transcriptional regulator
MRLGLANSFHMRNNYFAHEMNPMSRPRFIALLNSAQRRLQHWMAQEQAKASADGGVAPSPAQAGVLFALAQADGLTMGELATALDLAPSAMSGLVQRLETLDWVARHADEHDGRTLRVWLQPDGRAQLPALHKALKHINARLTEGFTEAELAVVARWLAHVQRLDGDLPPSA